MTGYPKDDVTLSPRHQLHELILEAIDAIAQDYDASAGAELDPAVGAAVHQRIEAGDALTQRLFDNDQVLGAFAAEVQGSSSEGALVEFERFLDEARLAALQAAAERSAVRLGLRASKPLLTATAEDLRQRTAALSPGSYPQDFIVSYASASAGHDNARLPSRVDITIDSTTIVLGREADFAVNVSGYGYEDPAPAGEVVLRIGQATHPSGELSNGSASYRLRLTDVGAVTARAEYIPELEGRYEASSGELAIYVEPRPTTTSVKLDPESSSYGEAVDLIAEVMDSDTSKPVPAGLEVEFLVNGSPLPSLVQTDKDGRATYRGFTPGTPGTQTISARFAGKDEFAGSEGAAALCVDKASADLTVKIDAPVISAGQTATVTATVVPGGKVAGLVTPTGTVVFGDGSGGTQTVLSGGVALWVVSDVAAVVCWGARHLVWACAGRDRGQAIGPMLTDVT